ncbi:dicarboxylate/amino acid:cation symporter [Phytoactinopolyspora mesophila]|uniref:Cation:dicarboxylase symporter family transporter n=1 Tax=Phytoactinopolyspora mesophila TaxID=2650750 RepID=A0A7K3LXZ2_9ACTN|nr:dicarboxylate/amino acid:cation symporter [Phytoactinopolyspora mesophila]NDL55893.1 cation:dicarboxylase symporter family transporter [Phytoactinopolyspora mesophila]
MTSESPELAEPSLWRRYLDFPLYWKLLIALVAGAVVGLAAGPDAEVLQPLGDLFLNLLMMIVFPLIVATLIVGVSSVSPARLGRIGGKVVAFYLVTSAFAITIGLTLAFIVNPGSGLNMPADGDEAAEAPSIVDTLVNIVPPNPVAAIVEGQVLPIVFLAIVAGLAIGAMRHNPQERIRDLGELLRRVAEGTSEVMFRIIRGVLEYAPVGVFALIAVTLGETGADALSDLAQLTAVVYGGVALQIVIYAIILTLFGIGLRNFFAYARTPMITAFVTRSSNGTLPVSTRAAQNMGVNEGVYGFSLPFGATVNMDGTALYVGASVIFVANVSGVDLSVGEILGVLLVGVLASIGTAGVPGAGLILLSMAITQAGLPFAAVALVAGIDAVLDMVRTMCNVTGDLTATRVVAQTEPGMVDEHAADETVVDPAEEPGAADREG